MRFLSTVATSVAVIVLVGFGPTAVAAADASRDSPTITILGEDSSNLAAIADMSRVFERETGTRVSVDREKFDALLPKANQDLALGTGRYDIILQYNFELSSYVQGGFVWQLGELKKRFPSINTQFEKNLFQNDWREVGFYAPDGNPNRGIEPFGYPFAANTLVLVYNRKMFAAAAKRYKAKFHRTLAPPKTWAEFKSIAAFFTNKKAGTYGVALEGAQGGWLYYEWATLLASQGIHLFPKKYGWERRADVPINLNRPDIEQATQFYLSLKPYNCCDYLKTDAVAQRDDIRRGNVAMAIMWSDYIFPLAFDAGVPTKTFGFAPVPGRLSPLAGGAFYINKHSRHVESAYKFLTWLLQPPQQKKMIVRGLLSPLRTAYTNEVMQKVPYARALKESLDRGTYAFEANKDAEVIQDSVTSALQSAWLDPPTLHDDLKTATGHINSMRAKIFSDHR